MNANNDSAAGGSSLVQQIVPQKVRITAEEWAAKARDKVECYHQVAHVFGAYVPAPDNITSWHLRDLSTGVKKMIKGTEVQHLHVPQYEHLTIPEFIKYIADYPFVRMCLPDRETEIVKLGRQYLINVIYTRLGEKFRKWVDQRVDTRHEEVKVEGNKYIELDPEIYALFKESKAISTNNGSAFHLFKSMAKRRRTKLEIEEDKRQEAAKKLDIETKLDRFAEMEQQMAQMQKTLQNQQHVMDHA